MATEKSGRFSSGQLLIAGAVLAAGILIGSGIVGATFIASQNERPEPAVTVTVSPSPTDPGLLHEENQEGRMSRAEEEMSAALSAAALAQENFYLEHGSYTDNVADLVATGLEMAPDVVINRHYVVQETYCLEAQHYRLPGVTFHISSEIGRPRPGTCPG